MRAPAISFVLLLVPAACGNTAPPAGPPAAASAAPIASAEPPAPDAGAKTADKYKLAEDKAHDDPEEREGPITLNVLVAKTTPKTAFPKPTVAEGECLKGGVPFTGNHRHDYQTIIERARSRRWTRRTTPSR